MPNCRPFNTTSSNCDTNCLQVKFLECIAISKMKFKNSFKSPYSFSTSKETTTSAFNAMQDPNVKCFDPKL
ncbi:hypothetical protein L3Y34_013433 [Caenorhabditis briggsae]|uniref:Uncharacterized protein n=1 Tax=Caenorhabditis briggsae TaxID=6238 RepID=A0AAE8ZRM8_CAEBR|nr:hypothetical protein L3Y34_013433 [Caenorhabditis briggsae]